MVKRFISTNNEFILGAIFGILLFPIAEFAWHIFWNYIFPHSWSEAMNEPLLSIVKFIILVLIATAILIVYFKTKTREPEEEKKLRHKELTDRLDKLIKTLEDNNGTRDDTTIK